MRMSPKSLWNTVVCFLLLFECLCQGAWAEGELPARFHLVSHVEEMADGALCIVAGEVNVNGQQKLSLMSNTYPMKDASKGKLKGFTHAEGLEPSFVCSSKSVVWKYVRNDDGSCSFVSFDSNDYLSYQSANKLGLKLSRKGSTSSWYLSERNDGMFDVKATADSNRRLCAGSYGNNSYGVFDHYASSEGVYIYVAESESQSGMTGEAVCPNNGEDVAVVCNDWAFSENSEKHADVSEYLLLDGSLAPDAPCISFICEWQTNLQSSGNPAFCLRTTQGYLSADLTASEARTLWCVRNGCIATCLSDGSWLLLGVNRNAGQWTCQDMALAESSGSFEPAHFCKITAAPTCRREANGRLYLKGGWSTQKLANLSLEGVSTVDLTEISLPRRLLPFKHSVETQNMPIFVAQESAQTIPTEWRFVVVCSATSNRLLRRVVMADMNPYFSDRNIEVAAKDLTYVRKGLHSGYWQTLCLPFDVSDVSPCVQLLRLKELTEEEAQFEECQSVKAGEAYLVKLRKNEGEQADVRFENTGNVLLGKPLADQALKGSFTVIEVGATETGLYLLKAGKSAFYPATNGCRIAPFRACLQTDGKNRSKALKLKLNP